MKTTLKYMTLIAAMCAALIPLFGEEEFRKWNDIHGRNFEAKIVSTKPGFVRLQNREGKEIDFQIAKLLLPDQKVVRDWSAKNGTSGKGSEFIEGFKDDLVILDGKKVAKHTLKNPSELKYVVYYKSASWCGPCKKFTPKLVEFYDKKKKDHPEFEVILVSSDRSKKDMENYMKSYEMPFPAFKHGKHKDLASSYGNGIPCLIVVDSEGNKLLDSYTKDKKYTGPYNVMSELEKLLEKS